MPAPSSQRTRAWSNCNGSLASAQAYAGIGAPRSKDRRAGHRLRLRQAQSANADQESGHVCAGDRHGADHRDLGPRSRDRRRAYRLRVSDHTLAVVHRVVCQLCGSRRRRPRQGASRDVAAAAHRNTGEAHHRGRRPTGLPAGAEHRPQSWRPRAGRSRQHHPLGRRGDPGHGFGQRSRHHRRIGAGDSRNPAAIAPPSPAARKSCPTGFACA